MMVEPGFVERMLALVAEHHAFWGPLVLFATSLVEYVFPPFPGDVVTLFGAYLVVQGLWSLPFAMALTVGGSLAGATIDYFIGRWLGRRSGRLPAAAEVRGWTPLTRERYAELRVKFRRYGALYIAVNRFLPGIRAFFFVAAGAAGMPLGRVLFYACLSAVAWNGLILGVGYAVGANWQRLRSLFYSYTNLIWIALAAAAVAGLIVWALRRRRRGDAGRGTGEGSP